MSPPLLRALPLLPPFCLPSSSETQNFSFFLLSAWSRPERSLFAPPPPLASYFGNPEDENSSLLRLL